MNGFDGGTEGYWRRSYYQRLNVDDDADGREHLPRGAGKPPSGRRRKPPSSSRRPKVVKVTPPPSQPMPSPSAQPSSTSHARRAAADPAPSSVATRSTAPTSRRRRRFWRIRLTPRLAFLRRVASGPARLLSRLQKGYVRMMLRFAGAMSAAGPEMTGYSFPTPALKEYDEKVLVEVYRALVAQGHVLVVPTQGAGTSDGSISVARLVAR